MTVSSSRRYLSVWMRRLATDRIARRSSAPDDAPLAVVETVDRALRIASLNDAAARLNLRVGMALADARAMYPGLPVADADPQADARLLIAIADWCDRYTPLIGLDSPDGLVLDITGCVHLFGGEAALCHDIGRRLAAQGFATRLSVADTVGCAWAVARYAEMLTVAAPSPLAGEGSTTFPSQFAVVPRGGSQAAVVSLPLAGLRLAPDLGAALAKVGLKSIADVIDMPRAPLAARFGVAFLRRLDQSLGREDEPISPRLPVPVAMAERRFPDPIGREEDVLGTIEQLARDLGRILERRGEGARLLQVALFRADGKVHRLELGTSAPVREPQRVRRLFAERLAVLGDACDPGFGYDMVRLSALVAERFDPPQTGFGAPDREAELAHLVDRLGARFGLSRVTRLVPQDTHIPEFAVAAMPAHAPRKAEIEHPVFEQDSLAPVRPVRLLARPEPIEVTALVPDGPPLRFRWRRIQHDVAVAEGPERIAMEWWRDDRGSALTRDYFRVESKDGARVWLYREGLYDREPGHPRWFLHGMFA
jgi:protein ImuB